MRVVRVCKQNMQQVLPIAMLFIGIVLSLNTYAGEQTPSVLTLKIGYDEQPPYRYTVNEKAVGVDINRVSAALDTAGIKYSFHPYPWKRILRNIELGKLDIALSAGKLEERLVYAHFSTSVFRYGSNALFVNNEFAPEFAGFKQLADLRKLPFLIGVRRAASYSDEYEALLQDELFIERLVNLNDTEQAIRLAMSNRIQGLIASPHIVDYELKKSCLYDQFTQVYDLSQLQKIETFLMFSRETVSTEIVEKIDAAMLAVDSPSEQFYKDYKVLHKSCDALL